MNTRRKKLPAPTNLGKIPAQAIDLEEAVLGAIMLEKEAITMVGSILHENLFYKEAHRVIYRAIAALNTEGAPIDLLTVTMQLRKSGDLETAGGAAYVTELTGRVSSSANIEYHSRVLQEQYMKREAANFGAELMRISFEDTSDPFDIIEAGTNFTLKVTGMVDNGRMVTVKSAMVEFLESLGKAMNRGENELTGITSGLTEVDKITGGWQSPDLIIVAGRPGSGKTSFVVRTLVSAATAKIPVAIFSLEMSAKQLVTRMAAQVYRIASVEDFKKGRITQDQYQYLVAASNRITQLPIHMDDTAGIRMAQIRAKSYVLVKKHGVRLIAVDYLQLITADDGAGNREQQISSISRGLKKLAKELNVPVIALSQLSRSVETRGGDKRPMLSDLRESGAIEQDADVIAFLYRPEYYGITEDESGNDLKGIAEVIIAKNRDGACDSALVKFLGKYTDFADLNPVVEVEQKRPSEIEYGRIKHSGESDFMF